MRAVLRGHDRRDEIAGLIGAAPKLLDLQDGDLKMSIDFRHAYAAVLDNWMDLPSKTPLGESFEPLELFR